MPSSSLFLRSSTTLVSVLSFISTSFAVPLASRDTNAPDVIYTLAKSYQGSSFFSENDWTYWPGSDPTHGFVTYGDKDYADSNQLIDFEGDYAVIKVDSKTKIDHGSKTYYKDNGVNSYYGTNDIGRKSLRIEGKYEFTHGLIITDIGQMPTGICGTWPAFWTLGTGNHWPDNGEIDIIEGSNLQQGNWMSLHTSSSSNINGNTDSFSARIKSTDCNLNNGDPQNPNYAGCTFEDPDPATYSAYTGGVWATQWTSERIKIWYWPYGSVPSDVLNGAPKPSSAWGTPRSSFAPPSNLRVDSNFYKHHVIFDTTFCGDLGDSTWASTGCAAKTGYETCADFVANEPSAFKDAKWKVKYVKIYSEGTSTITSSSSSTTMTTSKSSSNTATTSMTTTSSTVTSSTTTKPSSMTTTSQSSATSKPDSASLTTQSTSTTHTGISTTTTTRSTSTSSQTASGSPTKPTSIIIVSNTSAIGSTSESVTTKTIGATEVSTTSATYTSSASGNTTVGNESTNVGSTSKSVQTSMSITSKSRSSSTTSSAAGFTDGWESWPMTSHATPENSFTSSTASMTSKYTPVASTTRESVYCSGCTGDDQWITTTVIGITTVPCSTGSGYETKTYIYTTVISDESRQTKTWAGIDSSKATATSIASSQTWTIWESSKPTSKPTQSTSTWQTWDPKPSSKTTSTSSGWKTRSPTASVRVPNTGAWATSLTLLSSSTSTSVDPSWASWTGPVATQNVRPQPTQWSTFATKSASLPASPIKTPDGSATASGNWPDWKEEVPAGTTGNIAVYKGSAAIVKVQSMVVVALAILGGIMML